ncbi:MAG: helical backbone metal receptor [Cryomorphaceae bacterium]
MKRTFRDQIGKAVALASTPKRIVSIVPSQTELLSALGLENEVVGITKFCVHPESWFRTKKRVGGTKKINLKTVAGLKPDLILANKEENTLEDIAALEEIAPVWTSDIRDMDGALAMIRAVGTLVGKEHRANEIAQEIESQFASIAPSAKHKRILYIIWKDPYMAAGRDTFIQSMLRSAGFENAIQDPHSRYPALSVEEIKEINPEKLLLSSEPFPFKRKHTEEVRETFPGIEVQEVDGELFSWYGSRMLKSAIYFKSLQS